MKGDGRHRLVEPVPSERAKSKNTGQSQVWANTTQNKSRQRQRASGKKVQTTCADPRINMKGRGGSVISQPHAIKHAICPRNSYHRIPYLGCTPTATSLSERTMITLACKDPSQLGQDPTLPWPWFHHERHDSFVRLHHTG